MDSINFFYQSAFFLLHYKYIIAHMIINTITNLTITMMTTLFIFIVLKLLILFEIAAYAFLSYGYVHTHPCSASQGGLH